MDDLKIFAKNESEIDGLIPTIQILSDDIGLEFGIEKCTCIEKRDSNVI